MGRAEDIAFEEERIKEEQRLKERTEKNRELSVVNLEINRLTSRVVSILEENNFPNNPEIGLRREIMTVEGKQRAVWYVWTHEWSIGRNPMDHYYISSTGEIVSHYGHVKQLPAEYHSASSMELAVGIRNGLRRIVDKATPTPVKVAEDPESQRKKKWPWSRK